MGPTSEGPCVKSILPDVGANRMRGVRMLSVRADVVTNGETHG